MSDPVALDPGDLTDKIVQEVAKRVTRAVVRRLALLIASLVLLVGAVGAVAVSNHNNDCRLREKHNLLVAQIEEGARGAIQPDLDPAQQKAADEFVRSYTATIEAARVDGC